MPLLMDTIDEVKRQAAFIGFGFNHVVYQTLINADSPELLNADLVRYDVAALPDNTIERYNANQVSEMVWIGEGPYTSAGYSKERSYNNLKAFIQDVIFNKQADIQHIIALGMVKEPFKRGISFTPYFGERALNGFQSHQVKPLVDKVDEYELMIESGGCHKTIGLTHFTEMNDMHTLSLSDPLMSARLLDLYNRTNRHGVFIHCSAGLGRSGIFALAFNLFRVYDALEALPNDQARADQIIALWNELVCKRPGAVQTESQLVNAIEMADALHRLQLHLESEAILLDEYIDTLRLLQRPYDDDAASGEYESEGSLPEADELQSEDLSESEEGVCFNSVVNTHRFWQQPQTDRARLSQSMGDDSSNTHRSGHERLSSSQG